MSASAIYEGTSATAASPTASNEFTHRIALAYVDLDELPRLLGGRLARRGPGLVRFRRSDYLGDPSVPLATPCATLVEERTGTRPDGPDPAAHAPALLRPLLQPGELLLLLRPRRRAARGGGRRGDQHAVGRAPRVRARARPGLEGPVLTGDSEKVLHVSPFMGMDQRYEWRVADAGRQRCRCTSRAAAAASSPSTRRCRCAAASSRGRSLAARHGALPAATARVLALIYGHAVAAEAEGRARPPASAGERRVDDRPHRPPHRRSVPARASARGSSRWSRAACAPSTDPGPPLATVHVRSPRVWRKLLRGSRGLAESYFDGLWDSPDLTAVIRLAARNVEGIDRLRRRLAPAARAVPAGRRAF